MLKETGDQATLVIIGNGMVGWRLCRSLVERGVHKERSIVVFGEEPYVAYDRVNLTKYFELDKVEELFLSPEDWYREHGILLHTGERVRQIDPVAKTLTRSNGELIAYEDCVLATGSHAFIPPIDGVQLPNVFVYRTIEDIEAIREAGRKARRGLVIGGGLLGLEAANVLKDLNLETTIVQMSNTLMDRQLNEDGGGYLLREIAKLGISVRLSTATERIEEMPDGLRVHFKNAEALDVDLVIVATGIRPNDQLAQNTDLALAARGGFIVKDELATNIENIYAIGECASHHGTVYGLVAPGYQMADVLAARFAGEEKVFEGSDQSSRLKLFGVDVSTYGDYMEEGTYYVHRGEASYRSLVVQQGRLVGATVVGPWEQSFNIEQAVRERIRVRPKRCDEFVLTGDFFLGEDSSSVLNWPSNAIVCNCTNTRCGSLKELVAEGCADIDTLSDKTGAGGVCGSCKPLLAQFVGADAEAVAQAAKLKGTWLLAGSAILAVMAIGGLFFAPQFPKAETVQGWYYGFTQIWQDFVYKQISGYTLVALSLFALLLSARKRFRWFCLGNFGFWRAAHSWLGVTTLLALVFHTGMQFGENLNRWLQLCFIGLNLAGALAAIAVATEKRFDGLIGMRIRNLATKSHIVFFLPYPVLLGFHIAKVYLY